MPFLTFEGIDGSGKSSLLKSFAQHLKDKGLNVEITREPGGSPLGRELREILLRTKGTPPCPQAELLIYEADRAQHVTTVIKPWLAKNAWVLSDRFADSSLAFQGAGRHIPKTDVEWLNKFATGGLSPQMTVLLDCPVEVSDARRKQREQNKNQKADRFENEKREFHEAIRQEFLSLAREHGDRYFVLDAQKTPVELLEGLVKECHKRGLLP